jgi:DNA-binding NarL/FixJ family response regulator
LIKISIADNHPAVVYGIKCFLKVNSDISISDSVHLLKDLDDSLTNKKPDILIIDIELEGLYSINILKRIIRDNPQTKLLIYTAASEKLLGVTSLKIGVAGYVLKNEPLENIEAAILKIYKGEMVYSEAVYKSALTASKFSIGERTFRKLSGRESEVLQHLINGKKNNEISDLLNLNEKTISTYKLRLLNKFNVTNFIDLVKKAKTLEIG